MGFLLAAAWRMKTLTGLALALPLLNLLLIGRPDPATALILTFEVALFMLAAWNREKLKLPAWTTGAAAYLAAKAASFAALSVALLLGYQIIAVSPAEFVAQSLGTGWPGIVLLMGLSAVVFHSRRAQDANSDEEQIKQPDL